MTYKVVGVKIRTWEARNMHNLTLEDMEILTGISKSTLNNIENGKVSPTMHQMERIAKALDMKISDLYESEYK
ncbi:helix-turn-helix domain-containing protein [Anaerocolumna aminovalerica]|nr:helix-turn-helix transcriptional regulator [Anaerocolumna aminovalerica]MBU5331449.1 helix-turn-helix domain-containing protein [Anaerocolumna aminovalerica]